MNYSLGSTEWRQTRDYFGWWRKEGGYRIHVYDRGCKQGKPQELGYGYLICLDLDGRKDPCPISDDRVYAAPHEAMVAADSRLEELLEASLRARRRQEEEARDRRLAYRAKIAPTWEAVTFARASDAVCEVVITSATTTEESDT